jgi:hypothetical protein
MTRKEVPKKDKTPRSIIEAELCEMLAGRPGIRMRGAPPFPHKFKVVRPATGGAPIILKVENNTASLVQPDYAAGFLREYVAILGADLHELNVPFDICQKVIKSWSHVARDLVNLPKTVAFKSDPALCMTRLPFDPIHIPDEKTLAAHAPFFAEMLSRTTNADAFCMRVGSMFDPDADRKQSIWFSGPPDCGKSEFSWLVTELAGKGYGLLSNADLKTVYWKAQLVGKRVGIVHEATTKFIRSDEFKSITGDDEHSINQKNQPIFHASLPVLMFFFSNQPPEIPHDDALMTRIIDCRISSIPPDAVLPKSQVRAKIIEELPYIAGYCLARYAVISSGDRIPAATDSLHETIEDFESDYLDFLEHHFIEDENGQILCRDFKRLMLEDGIKSPMDQHICKRVFVSRFKVHKVRPRFKTNKDGTTKRASVYTGVRLREESERQFSKVTSEEVTVTTGQQCQKSQKHLTRIK